MRALTIAESADRPPIAQADPASNPQTWVAEHAHAIREVVAERGAVLVRGLRLTDPAEVESLVLPVTGGLMMEREGFAARRRVGRLHFSSDWPSVEPMCMHHELSYATEFPGLLVFGCLVPPAAGGAIGLADAATIASELPAGLVGRFQRDGWLLTRTYSGLAGIRWSEAFGTDDPDAVSQYCREHAIHHEWRGDGTLFTRQRRPAMVTHPTSGVLCWFNQIAFLNAHAMDPDVREYLRAAFGPARLPFNTSYGDGSAIAEETVRTINETYDANSMLVPLRAGDLLVVDNIRMAHSREAYRPPREVVVAMANPVRLAAIAPS